MSKILNYLKDPNSYINILFNVIIFSGSYYIFNEMFLDCPGDLIPHLNLIQRIAKHEISIPANFLYYLSVWILSSCSLIQSDLIKTVLIILPVSVVFKFVITKYAIQYIFEDINKLILNFAAFSLLIIMPIPYFLFIYNAHYLGYLTPNVWHNSTTIFLMPFAILLFVESDKLINKYSLKRFLIIILLIIINLLIKPSFLFVYLIVYPIVALKEIGFKKNMIYFLVISLVCLASIYIEYLLIYQYGNKKDISGGVYFSFMFAYQLILYVHLKISNTVTIFGSFVYFLTALFFSGTPVWLFLLKKGVLFSKMMFFSLICLIVASLIAIFVFEPSRPTDGNFLWQTYISMYMFFMVFLAHAIKYWESLNIKIILVIYLIHFFYGIAYIYNLIVLNQLV